MNSEPWKAPCERVYNKMAKYLGLHTPFAKHAAHTQLRTAFSLAWETSQGHVRKNGDTMFSHILQAADLLLLVKPDLLTMQLVLLHETIKECGVTREQLAAKVGPEVAELVARFTDLKKIRLHADTHDEIIQLRQMLLVLADDVRVILVKLSTRLSGLLTLEAMPHEKQIRLAKEMLEIYAPIAGRLGVYALKTRIEDEAFRVLHPKIYNKTESELEALTVANEKILETCRINLMKLMRRHKISGKIFGRVKSVYSTAHKMQQKHLSHVAELYDIFALRVVVQSKEDCYKLLGFIHEKYPPVANRLKDYIAMPKPNNYQSLHTTVTELYDPNPLRPVEVQIRTLSMDAVAEYGVASHGAYKESGSTMDHGELWQKKLALINKEFKRRGRIEGEDTADLSRLIAKVFVLTPKGDVIGLPQEATPLDFAYAIHTDIGNHCVGATVNGRAVPLSYTLRSGDTVQVVTRENHRPTGTSLLYAKTPQARAAINAFLKEEQRENYVERGRSLLDHALSEAGKPRLDPSMTVLDPIAEKEPGKRSFAKEKLLLQIGKGARTAMSVVRHLYPAPLAARLGRLRRSRRGMPQGDISWIVGGDADIPYALAKCCAVSHEIPVGNLTAYVSSEHMIRIHRRDCPHVLGKPAARFLSVELKSAH